MSYTTLISASTLASQLNTPNLVIVDCRFSLKDTESGRNAWVQAHIPNARYAHLDDDLSGPVQPDKRGGRHPLPDVATLAQTFGSWGITSNTQVVAYDDMGGAIASRLWFLLRWLGHEAVAVLDGGWQAWQAEGQPTSAETPTVNKVTFDAQPNHNLVVNQEEVIESLPTNKLLLLDARAPERYRGEMEPLDPKAGHIPGARSAPFAANLTDTKQFKSMAALQTRFSALLDGAATENTVLYCGSGVTACHNALALTHAGLDGYRLYVGSWSEWSNTPGLAVEIGEPGTEGTL